MFNSLNTKKSKVVCSKQIFFKSKIIVIFNNVKSPGKIVSETQFNSQLRFDQRKRNVLKFTEIELLKQSPRLPCAIYYFHSRVIPKADDVLQKKGTFFSTSVPLCIRFILIYRILTSLYISFQLKMSCFNF